MTPENMMDARAASFLRSKPLYRFVAYLSWVGAACLLIGGVVNEGTKFFSTDGFAVIVNLAICGGMFSLLGKTIAFFGEYLDYKQVNPIQSDPKSDSLPVAKAYNPWQWVELLAGLILLFWMPFLEVLVKKGRLANPWIKNILANDNITLPVFGISLLIGVTLIAVSVLHTLALERRHKKEVEK